MEGPVRFEETVPENAKLWEHRTAQQGGVQKRRSLDILDDVWKAGPLENAPGCIDIAGVVGCVTVSLREVTMTLTWRARMDRVKVFTKPTNEGMLIVGEELFPTHEERVIRLPVLIDADDREPGHIVAHRRTTSLAEKIEHPRSFHAAALI
jgi:hypothetical protein